MRVFQATTRRPLDLLAVSAGGRVAAASSAFGVRGDVDVWDSAVAAVATLEVAPREITSLAFSADGRLFAGWGECVAVFDDKLAPVAALDLRCVTSSFALRGPRIAVREAAAYEGLVTYRQLDSGMLFHPLWEAEAGDELQYAAPAVSPDLTRVAVGLRPVTSLGAIHIRAAASGTLLAKCDGDAADPFYQLEFSVDSNLLLGRTHGRAVKVFDAVTGHAAGEFLHPGRSYVTGLAVHPDGTVACSRTDGTVSLWDVRRRERTRTLDWKLGKLVSVAFSPDGAAGAAGTEDGRVVVWDVD